MWSNSVPAFNPFNAVSEKSGEQKETKESLAQDCSLNKTTNKE